MPHLLISILTLILFANDCFSAEIVPVYYSTLTPAQTRQEALRKELEASEVQPIVFAKYRDFAQQLTSAKPNAIVAPSFFSKYNADYKSVACFTLGDELAYKYLIMSLKEGVKPKDFSESTIGLVEEVDKAHLETFVQSVTGQTFKLIRSVTKAEDLVPLLVFGTANLILVSPSSLDEIRGKYSTPIYHISETKPVGSTRLFFRTGYESKKITEGFMKLPPEKLKALGFSAIKPCGD